MCSPLLPWSADVKASVAIEKDSGGRWCWVRLGFRRWRAMVIVERPSASSTSTVNIHLHTHSSDKTNFP
ncbi:hypothetical protein Hdeb2414_s0007g00234291 [Helianthus debilis subsp. tardiflorus]